jgi:acyl carrier protein
MLAAMTADYSRRTEETLASPQSMEMEIDRLPSLLAFLSREFAAGSAVEPKQRLVPDLVDSLGVFVLVDFVEQEWGVVMDDKELNIQNLATPEAFCSFIDAKARRR